MQLPECLAAALPGYRDWLHFVSGRLEEVRGYSMEGLGSVGPATETMRFCMLRYA